MKRCNTITQKVKTQFGTMHIHIDFNEYGQAIGGKISTPGKEPNNTINNLVEILSIGLNAALSIEETPIEVWYNFHGDSSTVSEKDHLCDNGKPICGANVNIRNIKVSHEEDNKCGRCLIIGQA